jgi:hypothetical protein
MRCRGLHVVFLVVVVMKLLLLSTYEFIHPCIALYVYSK